MMHGQKNIKIFIRVQSGGNLTKLLHYVLLSYMSYFLFPQLNHVKKQYEEKLLTLLYYFLLFIFPSCI